MTHPWLRRLALACSLSTLVLSACAPAAMPAPPTQPVRFTETATLLPASATASSTPLPTDTPTPSKTSTPSPLPTVESLKATVTDLLTCRYGPGPEYLYLYALRKDANIKLIGRVDEGNWHWVYVEGKNKCWVNANFLEIEGDWMSLPIVYPGLAKLPRSPYYPPTTRVEAKRQGNTVKVTWNDIPLRAGDEEDQFMLHYIIEVWRCQGGQMLFEPLATNDLSVTFTDEPGCSQPSHGRVLVQEKHGFAGPTEIPWPTPEPGTPTASS